MDRTIEKKKWSLERILPFTLGGLVVLIVLYALISGSGNKTLKVNGKQITTSSVFRGTFQDFIPVTGKAMPINTVYLDAVEGGRVEKIFVEAGSMVKKGEKILNLSNANLLMTVLNNEAMVNRAVYDLRVTRLQMEQNQLSLQQELNLINMHYANETKKTNRVKKLFEEEVVAENYYENFKYYYAYVQEWRKLTSESLKRDLDFRKEQVKQLEESVAALEKNLEIVKKQVENLTIRAAISGHLTSLNVEVGESKAPGERMGQIDVLDGFKVRAGIDEHFITRVDIGKEGECQFNDRVYSVRVKKVYPEVKDGQFEVDLEFDKGEPEGIKRGQTLNLRLQLSSRSEALLLSRGAFFHTTGGDWVFVVDESSRTAVRRNIRLGRQNSDYFEVLEGLEPGEKVIISDYREFAEIERLIIKR